MSAGIHRSAIDYPVDRWPGSLGLDISMALGCGINWRHIPAVERLVLEQEDLHLCARKGWTACGERDHEGILRINLETDGRISLEFNVLPSKRKLT